MILLTVPVQEGGEDKWNHYRKASHVTKIAYLLKEQTQPLPAQLLQLSFMELFLPAGAAEQVCGQSIQNHSSHRGSSQSWSGCSSLVHQCPSRTAPPTDSLRHVQTQYFDSFTSLLRLGKTGLWSQKISLRDRQPDTTLFPEKTGLRKSTEQWDGHCTGGDAGPTARKQPAKDQRNAVVGEGQKLC